MTTIIITPQDVEAAQVKQDIILTDCNNPLELLCTAYDIRTYNEREENNWDYINEQKSYIIENNLSYEKVFLSGLTADQKLHYADNIEEYDTALDIWTQDQKNLIELEQGHDELQAEYAKEEQEMYAGLWKERLHGDYRNDGAIELLQTKMTRANNNYDVELSYDENTQAVTITIDDDEDDEDKRTRDSFIAYLVRSVVAIKADRRAKAEQRRKEREEKAKRVAEHKEREKQKKREKILQER